jgi:hypothetical protein
MEAISKTRENMFLLWPNRKSFMVYLEIVDRLFKVMRQFDEPLGIVKFALLSGFRN